MRQWNTDTLSDIQKRRFLSQQSTLQDLALSLAIQFPQPVNQTFAATILLRWNQVQAEEAMFLQRLTRQSGDPKIQTLATQISQARSDLSFLADQKEPDANILQNRLAALEKLETELSQYSLLYKQQLAARSLNLDVVHSALPRDSALLAFKVYYPWNSGKQKYEQPHYLALLLPADTLTQPLQLQDLGSVTDINPLIEQVQQNNSQAAKQLYQTLLSQWDTQLANYKSLYLIPDSQLNLINFEQLQLTDGQYWLQRQPLHRLQTARDLLRMPPIEQGRGLLALGGINYGTLPTQDTTPQLLMAHIMAHNDIQRNIATQLSNGFRAYTKTNHKKFNSLSLICSLDLQKKANCGNVGLVQAFDF